MLHCSLPKYRASPPPVYRGHWLGAALLERSSCTSKGCCRARPPHPRRGQKVWLARPLPVAVPGTGGVKLFLSTQEGNIPNNHSLRVPWFMARCHCSWHLFCLYIPRETSTLRPKPATEICCSPGQRTCTLKHQTHFPSI